MAIFIDQCKRLEIAGDAGAGGGFTLSHVMDWLAFIYFLPSKLAMIVPEGNSALWRFFELDCGSGTHWGGAIFSGVVWVVLLSLVSLWGGKKRAKRG